MTYKPTTAELHMFMGEIFYYEKGIYNMIEDMVRFKPKNKQELVFAIEQWKNKIYHNNALVRFGPIEIWNTLLITDMSYLFGSTNDWTVPYWKITRLNLTGWNVSNVTNMEGMFKNSYYDLDTNFEKWNVGKVINMSYMFYKQQRKFNPILNSWDISSVTNMSFMFYKCTSFNSNIDKWDLTKVENMENMFDLCDNNKFNT